MGGLIATIIALVEFLLWSVWAIIVGFKDIFLDQWLYAIAFFLIYVLREALGTFWAVTGTVIVVGVQLRFGIDPPLPASVIKLFMAFVLIAAAIYVTSSEQLRGDYWRPIRDTIVEADRFKTLCAVLLLIPLLAGWQAWKNAQPDVQAPARFRVVHPAPPSSVSVGGTTVDVKKDVNPYRALKEDDPDKFAAAVKDGKRIYYQNCYFCHGDDMYGEGHYALGLNPRPISFQNKTTIAMFTETFLYWRVAKGGPGLPKAATPWDSAMPAWEDFLTSDEIWKVVLYLYEHTKQQPRMVSSAGAQ